MISSVGQNDNIQRFSAVNALKSSVGQVRQKEENSVNSSQQEAKVVAPKSILDRVDVNEIRECAKSVGEYDISDEEIKYGLIYGRSVIAEYLC